MRALALAAAVFVAGYARGHAVEVSKRVAFIGGSITEMDGYRPLVMKALRERHPGVKFSETAAGVASTCSDAGAFRFEEDVLAFGAPDLLVVEESVNDEQDGHFDSEHAIRGMEGIVRHALIANPACKAVIALFPNRSQYEKLRSGMTPEVHAAHRKVARHYGLEVADVGEEIAEASRRMEFSWEEYREVHPSPAGCRFAAEVVMRAIDRAFNPLMPVRKREPPPPLDPKSYFNGAAIPLASLEPGEGWNVSAPDWDRIPGVKRDYYRRGEMLWSETPGAEMEVGFDGSALALFVVAGPDCGDLDVSVDGGEFVRHRLRHNQGTLHYPYVEFLVDDLVASPHKVRFRTVARELPDGGRATAIRVFRVFAN